MTIKISEIKKSQWSHRIGTVKRVRVPKHHCTLSLAPFGSFLFH